MSVIVTFGFLVYGNCSNLLGDKLWEECHGPHVFLAVSHWLPFFIFVFLFLYASPSLLSVWAELVTGSRSWPTHLCECHHLLLIFPQLLFKAVAQSSSPLER